MRCLFFDTLALAAALLTAGAALGATPVGSQFQVNSSTINSQFFPSVAVDADGDFVVVWASRVSSGTDTSGYSIQGQRYLPEPSQMLQLGSCILLLLALARRRGVIGA